jgi:hypothetical protein
MLPQDILQLINKLQLPGEMETAVSLFDGAGQLWHIFEELGVNVKNKLSSEVDPAKALWLGGVYGYRNPPEWMGLKPDPNGLIYLGGIYQDGTFKYEGERRNLAQIAELLKTKIEFVGGGPTCKSKSVLNTTIKNKQMEKAASNVAKDIASIVVRDARTTNPDLKVFIENVRNQGKDVIPYNYTMNYLMGNPPLEDMTKFGVTLNTPKSSATNRTRTFWTSHELPEDILTSLNLKENKKFARPDDLPIDQDDPENPWKPLRNPRLGAIVAKHAPDVNAITKELLKKHTGVGTMLVRPSEKGMYKLVERKKGLLTPAIIRKAIRGITEKTQSRLEPLEGNDELLIHSPIKRSNGSLGYANFKPKTVSIPRDTPFEVRLPTALEKGRLMGLKASSTLTKEQERILKSHPEVFEETLREFPEAYTNSKGKVRYNGHKSGELFGSLLSGDSWEFNQAAPLVAGLLASIKKSLRGYNYGGYVEAPKKSQPIGKLASKLKELGRYS